MSDNSDFIEGEGEGEEGRMDDGKPEGVFQKDLIKGVLATLREISSQIYTEDSFKREIAKQLKDNGYDGFFGEEQEEDNIDADHVIKVLALSINNAMTRKMEIGPSEGTDADDDADNADAIREKLDKLLEVNDSKSMDDYLTKGWRDSLATATSPFDLAKHVRKSAPQWLVRNLLKRQFEIRWATETGEPRDFTYREFCEEEGTTKHLKYKPRKAQVMVRLYRECRKRSPNELRLLSEEQLCPTVYVRTTEGWKGWEATSGTFEAVKCNEEFKWMNESVRNFVLEQADEMRSDGDCEQNRGEGNALERCLEKPALYWAVVQDHFRSGENSQSKEIGNTQVYVGTAENGMRARWLDERGSHCEAMKKCVDNARAMTTYDPLRLRGIELVEARLTLAKVRRDRCALFLVKTFDDDVEKATIAREKATAACAEANTEWKKAKKGCADTSEKLKKAAQSPQCRDRIKELRRANKAADGAKEALENASESVKNAQQVVLEAENALETTTDPTDAVVKERLRNAEARHKDGKQIGKTNASIIPFDDDGNRLPWKPKNMAFGMNSY